MEVIYFAVKFSRVAAFRIEYLKITTSQVFSFVSYMATIVLGVSEDNWSKWESLCYFLIL